MLRNKLYEFGALMITKAGLVANGYSEAECINYDETFAPGACLEAIRLLLVYACYKIFFFFGWM